MTRPFNFSPGPAALPEPVLRQAAAEMLDWHGSGMSVMEMSHRGKEFMSVYAETLAALRALLAIPDSYKVLFLQGGAIGQNAIVPMNLLRGKDRADYVNTGDWAKRSIAEAAHFCKVNVAASSEPNGFTAIPRQDEWKLDPGAAYVHICSNETIIGLEYQWTPDTGSVPLVADMSSNILSRPIDVSRYGLIYAGAQKNIGPAGLTLVIVREDLLGGALPMTPSAFDYTIQAANDSMINTPPTYAIYMAGLVFAWIKKEGGLAAMAERNAAKAALLYGCLDASGFYRTRIVPADRSRMNVTFHLPDAQLDASFLDGAAAAGLLALKGHRVVGGMRASIYNAMPIEGVRALVAYLKDFEARHG
ncbi:MAG TPA: 3-phosphoserine/phosphohydroxythreonine transaminase [Caldimonas sp.]